MEQDIFKISIDYRRRHWKGITNNVSLQQKCILKVYFLTPQKG